MGYAIALGLAFFLPVFSWASSDGACPRHLSEPARPEPTWRELENAVTALREMVEVGPGEIGTSDYLPPLHPPDALAYAESVLPDGRNLTFSNVVGIRSALSWLHSNGFRSLFPTGPDGVAMKLSELRDEGYLRHLVVRHPKNARISRPTVLIEAFLEAESAGKWVMILYRFGN